jgi:hypothetical protein
MLLTLRPEPTTSPATLVPSSARPAESPAAPTQPAAAPPSPAKPAGLRSDRFALVVWLVCAGLMSAMLLKDLVVALFSW